MTTPLEGTILWEPSDVACEIQHDSRVHALAGAARWQAFRIL